MSTLEIEATASTPGVYFNYEKGELSIYGRSLNNNVDYFFKPLIRSVDEYIKQPCTHTIVSLNLEYLNTVSANYIFTILKKLKLLTVNEDYTLTVKWEYDAEDDDMLQNGKVYSEMLHIPFEFIEGEEA